MNEFEKLRKLLKANDIPFEESKEREHICYPCFGNDMICSVVPNGDNYLEILGLIDDSFYEFYDNEVTESALKAEEVFNKIYAYHFCKDKDNEYIFAREWHDRKIYIKNTHRPKDIFSSEQLNKMNNMALYLEEIKTVLYSNEYFEHASDIINAICEIESVVDHFKKEEN